MQYWMEMRRSGNTGEFDRLPIITVINRGKEVDLGQPLAVLRSFGIKFGYYNPSDWE